MQVSLRLVPMMLFLLSMLIMHACKPSVTDKPVIVSEPPSAEATNPYSANDQSPMDVAYFPADYPILKMNGAADSTTLVARVLYSRPQRKGRQIFGTSDKVLCPYGKPWRLGANEATEIEWFKDAQIGGKLLKKGRYILYCVPYNDRWMIIFNNNLFTWGLHIDRTRDVLQTEVPVSVQSPPLEDFTLQFLPSKDGTQLLMAWDNVKTMLPVQVGK